MPEDKLDRLLRRFATAAEAHHKALEEMNEQRVNAHALVIAGLYASIVREGCAGKDALLDLLESESDVVAGMAAVYSIRYRTDRCLAVLQRLKARSDLLGFRAEVAIQRWESGEWEDL